MKSYTDIQDEIRRYLLGTLPEESRRGVEERLMTEEDFLEELTLAEGELIDDYVAGRLSADERSSFERHFLSSGERREQLRFTRALGRYAAAAARGPAAKTSGPTLVEQLRGFWGDRLRLLRAALALAAVASVVVAVWFALPRAPRTFAALTLVAGAGERAGGGGGVPRVRLPLGADALKVTLTLPAGAPPADAYRAEMLAVSKGSKEAVEVAAHDGRSVTAVVPEDRLSRGRYALTLYAVGGGAEARVGDSYVFDVE